MPQRVNDGEVALLRNPSAMDFLRERYGWTDEAIVDARLGLEGDRFLFPSQDLDGAWYYTTRQWNGDGPKYKHDLPAPQLYLPKPIDQPVVLCEGHSDTVTALSMGLNAMGLMGVSTVNGVLPRLKSYPEVTVLMDADAAGWKATRAIVTGLLESDTKVMVAFLMPRTSTGLRLAWPEPFGAWYAALESDLTEYHKEGMGAPSVIEGPVLRMLKNPPPPKISPRTSGRSDIDVGKILTALTCGNRCPCEYAARRGWGAVHCPAHSDPSPSFSVKEKDGRVLVHCFAGCDQSNVIDALREKGLWPKYEPNTTAISTRRGESYHRGYSRFSRGGLLTPRISPGKRFLSNGESPRIRGGSGHLV